MTDKRIIVVLCLLLIVSLSLVNLLVFSSISENKITGLSVSEPSSAKSITNSAGRGILDYFVNVGEPESHDSSYSSSDDVSATNSQSGSGGSNSGGQEPENSSSGGETTSSECLQDYGLSENTIIFYYANEPHSDAMKTIVIELSSTYEFYWQDMLWDSDFNECFGTSGATPAFVCAGTGEKLIGEVPKSMLENFAEEC